MGNDTRTLRLVIVGNEKQARAALRGLAGEGDRTGRAMQRSGSRTALGFSSMSGAFLRVAKVATGATVAVAAGAALVAKKIYDVGAVYEQSLNQIQALGGLTDSQLNSLAKQLEGMSPQFTKMGLSTGDAAGAMVELVKAGMSANDALKSVTATMQLAKAGGMETADAAALVSNTLNAFGLKAGDAARVANVLANAANISSADVSDLAFSLSMAQSVAAQAGLSIEQVSALLAELANKGLKGSDAGTSLKTMLLALQAPSSTASKAMEKLGVSVFDAHGKMKPLNTIIDEFNGKLKKLTPQEQAAAKARIFGTDAIRAANIILGDGTKQLSEYTKGVTKAGAAQALAESKSKGLSGAFTRLKAMATSAAQAFYRQVSPPLANALNGLLDGVSGLGEKLRPGLGDAEKSIRNSGFIKKLLPLLQQWGQFFVKIFMEDILPAIKEFWTKAQPVLMQLWQTFKTVLDAIVLIVKVALLVLKVAWALFGSTIISTVKGFLFGVLQAIKGALQIIQGVLDIFIGLFTGDWSRMWNGVKTLAAGVWNLIIGGIKAIFFGTMLKLIGLGMKAITGIFSLGWRTVAGNTRVIWAVIKALPGDALNFARARALSAMNALLRGMRGVWSSLRSTFISGANNVLRTVSGLPGRIIGFFRSLPGRMAGIGGDIIRGLLNGIRNKAGEIAGTIQAWVIDKIPGPIRRALGISSPSKVMRDQVGRWIPAGVAEGIRANSGEVSDAMASLVDPSRARGNVAQRAAGGLARTSLGAATSGAGGVTVVIQNLRVEGSVIAERDLARGLAPKVRDELVRIGGRNAGNTGLR